MNEEVKENAVRCIDDGRFMERWRGRGKKAFEKRKAVLRQIRYNLLNVVNPVRKKFPKCKSYLREKSPFKVGDYIPSLEEISRLKFKKLLNRVEYVRCNVGNPYYIKKMRPAYKLDSVEYLEIGELCELDVIGNDMDFSLEDVGLWNEYPYSICFDYSLNITLYNSFTEYDYQEEWG